ncbi:MAG TPA: NERD domain-containing protein [Lacunisphaera sp.]|nr:NERD domain-containing protein [Lacunisphaera sp.]
MTWKHALIAGLYFAFFMISALAILWWQRRQRKLRLPFGAGLRLVRGPGETQLKRSRKFEEDMQLWLIVAGGMPVLIAATLFQWISQIPRVLVWAWLALVVIVFIATFIGAARWFARKTRESYNHYLGYFGERIVAEFLEPLKQEGWRVFHDVPGQNNGADFNLDHVAVGPGGLWVIETKTRRKGNARPGFDDHRVYFDGRELVWPWGEDSHGLAQAERNALWLGKLVESETNQRVHVSPVLVLPGWFVERKPSTESRLCRVANPKILPDLLARDQGLLTRQQIDAIAAKLETRCRDVEY